MSTPPPQQSRADLRFEFDNYSLGDTRISYGMNDFLVRVEKHLSDGQRQVRYGVMVDVENDQRYWKNTYIIEIPAPIGPSADRQIAQEEKINAYIDEMRIKFEDHYEASQKQNTVDEFHKQHLDPESLEGRWNILRQFRLKELTPFTEWLFGGKHKTKEDLNEHLTRARMSFETNETYSISTDWACPYICFAREHDLGHMKGMANTGGSLAHFFRPFHDYAWQKDALSTRVNVGRDNDYTRDAESIQLKPNNYSLFAFYSHLLDESYRLQQENFEEIKHLHVYTQSLTAIKHAMLENSPLGQMSEREIETLMNGFSGKWDGSTDDHTWGSWGDDHDAHIALGINDLNQGIQFFNQAIVEENKRGRNRARSMDLQVIAHSLMAAFFSATAQENYADLWCFSHDTLGTNLMIEQVFTFLSQSPKAQAVYDNYLSPYLYNNDLINTPEQTATIKDWMETWGNMLYRGDNIIIGAWMAYYPIHEGHLNRQGKKWASKSLQEMQEITAAHHSWNAQSGAPKPAIYGSAAMMQAESLRKLANYLMGGGQTEALIHIEKQLSDYLLKHIAFADLSLSSPQHIEQMAAEIIQEKNRLTADLPTETRANLAGHTGNISSVAINALMVAGLYTFAGKDPKWQTTEGKLRIGAMGLGLFSDTANMAAKFAGLEVSLSKHAASGAAAKAAQTKLGRKMGAQALARTSLGLGALQFLGGGAGGVIGAGWLAYDAVRAGYKGKSKDALLDAIGSVGVVMTLWGMVATGTVVGIPAGIALNVIGFTLLAVSQILKYFRVFNNQAEDYCKHLNGESVGKFGMDRLRQGIEEVKSDSLAMPFELMTLPGKEMIEDLLKRIDTFITDGDTYDKMGKKREPMPEEAPIYGA